MLDQIITELKSRPEVSDWAVRHLFTHGHQLYSLGQTDEARRTVADQHFEVDVFRQVTDEQGRSAIGKGTATLLVGDPPGVAIAEALSMADLVRNPPYRIPGSATMPDVPLLDDQLSTQGGAVLESLSQDLRTLLDAMPQVRLSAAEFFTEEIRTQMVNSQGLQASQRETRLYLEWTLIAGQDGDRVESFGSLSRRRLADFDLQATITRHARNVVALLSAEPPSEYQGAVLLRGETLGVFLNAAVLKFLSAASARYNQETAWEVGKPIHAHKVQGDPLTMWADRSLPYGTQSNRFDEEGLPAQRHLLVEEHRLAGFTADSQYADYLSIPATGAFGNLVLAPGSTPEAALASGPHVEVAAFSWFFPDILSGDFASEIRQGYVVDGDQRTPFKGGMLVGNYFQALANVRWSSETGFFGDYHGPVAARFEDLTVSAGK